MKAKTKKQAASPSTSPKPRKTAGKTAAPRAVASPDPTAATRKNPGKSPGAKPSPRDKLASELVTLIPNLDEDGLSFLLEQARVHLYNMEIDRQNAEALSASQGKPASKKGSKAARASSNAPSSEAPSRADFRIERSGSGSSYHLISGGKWKMFNEAEMLRMVKIAASSDPVREVAARLHAWLTAERPDTFADLDLGDSHDPRMDELVLFLRSKFALKIK